DRWCLARMGTAEGAEATFVLYAARGRRGAIWRFWGFERMMSEVVRITPEVAVPVAELEFRASRASGPGGQGVNTTDSRVELRFDLAGSPARRPRGPGGAARPA